MEPKNSEKLLEKIEFVLESKEDFSREVLTWEKVAKSYIECFKEG